MLLPTMTPEEIYAEISKDSQWLQERINNYLTPLYGKRVKRLVKLPDIHDYIERSRKTGIEYRVFFTAYRRGDWDKPVWFVTTQFPYEGGRTFIYLENVKGLGIRIYTTHFMKRFREREAELFKKYEEVSMLDLEHFFIFRNRDVEEMTFFDDFFKGWGDEVVNKKYEEYTKASRFYQDPDYERFVVACPTGVCLCERNKNNPLISIYDTYISSNMLKVNQMIDWVLAFIRIFSRRWNINIQDSALIGQKNGQTSQRQWIKAMVWGLW